MRVSSLTELARAGFDDLSEAQRILAVLSEDTGVEESDWINALGTAADPDQALVQLARIAAEFPDDWAAARLNTDAAVRTRFARLIGASRGFGAYFLRHPELIAEAILRAPRIPDAGELTNSLLASVRSESGVAGLASEAGWDALRTAYRLALAQITLVDIEAAQPADVFEVVAAGLSDLAAAALEAALAVARATTGQGIGVGKVFTPEQVRGTRIAIIAMGKCGARELNYVSDVDVIFVGESVDELELPTDEAIACATRLATETMRALQEPSLEPPLWQVDANLRPEGKDGALVRSLESHVTYYQRWAKGWEYQALLKARPVAGDRELGEEYVAKTRQFVWQDASREDFVESAQRMRERVMEHIPTDQVERQLKLGPGGLRDVEFTVQLLQLVHGRKDDSIRARATLEALGQLARGGYIGRADADYLSASYRRLRVLEHRVQLRDLARTALFPDSERDQRWLARSSGLASSAEELLRVWEETKNSVRDLHLKMFYAPLLSAVAALPGEDFTLTGEEAADRLQAIGFADPQGALRHIAALSKGVSRRAAIQRNLLPVILQWLSDGPDPDYGLLAFRRISDSLGTTPWYLRLLRDGSGAALRLSRLLASSRFVGELMESIPESVAWLEGDEELQPLLLSELREEMDALAGRHQPIDAAMPHLLGIRRREMLRIAIGALLEVLSPDQVSTGLTELHEALIAVTLQGIRATPPNSSADGRDASGIDFAVIGLGRFGGAELGFSSDLDLMYVYRALDTDTEGAALRAKRIAEEMNRLLNDPRLPLDLDLDLRPEGKSGPLARSLDSCRAYYEKWSLTWEAQALLRARGVTGDAALLRDITILINEIRYPAELSANEIREIRRLKARVEAERLPQGADPTRHLKLGKGSVSDVEWLVQLRQMEFAHEHPELRVASTLGALAALERLKLIAPDDASTLREAWLLSSRLRSAQKLWANRTSDVLPRDRRDLDGIAQILGFPPGATTQLEEAYLSATRRARVVFEREFYGYDSGDAPRGYVSRGELQQP